MRGLADFVTALLKAIESQARGFAHGHGFLDRVVHQAIERLVESNGGEYPPEDVIQDLFQNTSEEFNARLLASAQTRQYESATLLARQH